MKEIPIADPHFTAEDHQRILAEVPGILDGRLSMGPRVAAFEREFAVRIGVKHAIAVNAGTSALEIALGYLRLEPGDEVIVPAQTFIATGTVVHLAGAKVVFAEIEADTLCLDPDDVRKKISPATRAVIVVHFAGLVTPRIDELKTLCAAEGLFLIEDAAHTPGAVHGDLQAGGIGDAGCFSFYPTKIITCGEGGMLTTGSDEIAAFARSLQNRGRDFDAPGEVYALAGRNVRMPEFSALLGRVQLERLDDNLARRRRNATLLRQGLQDATGLTFPFFGDGGNSAWWKFPVLLAPEMDRDQILKDLHVAGIRADKCYDPALHLQPFFVHNHGTKAGMLPVTESIMARHLCLPCQPRLEEDDIAYVADTLRGLVQRAR